MKSIIFSPHAEKRCQQRHISTKQLFVALNRGERMPLLARSHYKYTYNSIVAIVRVTNRGEFMLVTCYRND
jgi:Mor family transcriptional regulator